VHLGRRLVFLHTYGERFAEPVDAGIPQGKARCTKTIPSRPESYPDRCRYDASTQTLYVGQGAFAPVSAAVWEFSVSGWEIVKSWLAYRMKDGAGRRSSPLDEIRPERWTAELTDELLQLLWVLEASVALLPELGRNLAEVVAGTVLLGADLPRPKLQERRPPKTGSDGDEAQTALPTV
jgi:hypothetical protein